MSNLLAQLWPHAFGGNDEEFLPTPAETLRMDSKESRASHAARWNLYRRVLRLDPPAVSVDPSPPQCQEKE